MCPEHHTDAVGMALGSDLGLGMGLDLVVQEGSGLGSDQHL